MRKWFKSRRKSLPKDEAPRHIKPPQGGAGASDRGTREARGVGWGHGQGGSRTRRAYKTLGHIIAPTGGEGASDRGTREAWGWAGAAQLPARGAHALPQADRPARARGRRALAAARWVAVVLFRAEGRSPVADKQCKRRVARLDTYFGSGRGFGAGSGLGISVPARSRGEIAARDRR